MSPYFIIVLVVQVLLIVHCIRTGRNTIWIWVLALLSLPGAIAYLAVEVIPDLLRSRATRGALRGVRRALDPEQQLRAYAAAAERTGDVASRQRYAEELLRQGQAERSAEVYRQALGGLYEHDPNLMLGLAQAQFAAGHAAEARATLDELIARNPDFKSPDGHLLYARALEGEGKLDQGARGIRRRGRLLRRRRGAAALRAAAAAARPARSRTADADRAAGACARGAAPLPAGPGALARRCAPRARRLLTRAAARASARAAAAG